MKPLRFLLVGLLVASLTAPSARCTAFEAGTAVVDISPQAWPLAPRGSFTPTPVDSIHDPLNVRCLVLKNGDTRIAIAVVDSCMVHRDVLDPAKQLAEEKTGIPADHISVSATHTHSAPFANAQHATPQELAYQAKLSEGITEAIVQADSNRRPAQVGWSGYDLPDEVFNRRWFLKAGTVPTNPFGEDTDIVKMNPPRNGNLINPAGPTDPEVSVLYVTDDKGRAISVLANYSLHYVGNVGGQMSADYFGEFARLMPTRLGRPADSLVAMMSNGTSGDVNNLNFRFPRPRREPYEQIRIVASKAADAATLAIRQIPSRSADPLLAMRQREISLKHRVPTTEQLERAKRIVAMDSEQEKTLPQRAKIYAQRTISLAAEPPTTEVLIQTIRIGDLAICTFPFEVFAEIGLDLKARSPAADTFVMSLTNGGYGYLPTPQQHQFGGYETWLGTNKVQKDASVILTDNLLQMLDELFPKTSDQ